MGIINYTTITLNKEGVLVDGDVTYNISIRVLNSDLIRLSCSISKQLSGNESGFYVGSIALENGRQIIEIAQGEDIVIYLNRFKEILDEVLEKDDNI